MVHGMWKIVSISKLKFLKGSREESLAKFPREHLSNKRVYQFSIDTLLVRARRAVSYLIAPPPLSKPDYVLARVGYQRCNLCLARDPGRASAICLNHAICFACHKQRGGRRAGSRESSPTTHGKTNFMTICGETQRNHRLADGGRRQQAMTWGFSAVNKFARKSLAAWYHRTGHQLRIFRLQVGSDSFQKEKGKVFEREIDDDNVVVVVVVSTKEIQFTNFNRLKRKGKVNPFGKLSDVIF